MAHHHYREPIKHTCPNIDWTQDSVRNILTELRYIVTDTEPVYIERAMNNVESIVNDVVSKLEELRRSNDTLRQWGIDEASRADELEEMLDDVESKYSDECSENAALKQKIKELENEVEELNNMVQI